ncbi:hypothetical protein [Pseudoalteromonas umbrosa]|uniref:hypothetical protein n=1 Tax=Pseudoalteromonas umbrosa TaxID=3048489 RepID=UPI0024C22995|nr:hypothetical protein [Pseudoalteromonas sp. B95]MDK1290194.1 hypothetical protein [Pseudoalteromonas sp. B95]
MAEFKPYSVTRGGFATPRELFMSVVKDLTGFYDGEDNNAFEITYPTDYSDLDFNDPNNADNDVIIVQATSNVDACVDGVEAKQPWVIRFDTQKDIGHGMGHINVTTPLQIDWTKPRAPAIPYIPPDTAYIADKVDTEGTLGFVGHRKTNDAYKENGFINRAIYHTKVTQVQKIDDFGNLLWNLTPISGNTGPEQKWGSRGIIPKPGMDELGRVTYEIKLKWFKMLNADEVDLNAVYPTSGKVTSPPAQSDYDHILKQPLYEEKHCTLYIRSQSGLTDADMSGQRYQTYKVEGELPPSINDEAIDETLRDENGLAQQVAFTYKGSYPELNGWKIEIKDHDGGRYTDDWRGKFIPDTNFDGVWGFQEYAVKQLKDFVQGRDDINNVGVEIYDNSRYTLSPVTKYAFDEDGDALDPRAGALNVPLSYALTVSDHGIVLAVWDQAVDQYETNEGHRFSWLNIQRLVDKDTGAPLIDQNKSFCPLFCMYGVYHEKTQNAMYFVVRESDVHRPSEELTAGEDSPDSNAVLNTYEQVAVSEDYEYVITVPSGLTTQRYLYLEEADLIGYTSADVISNGALSEFAMYDEGVCSVTGHSNEAACVAGGGEWTSTTRLYKGLPSTGKFNTGMRMLMRWYGGRLGTIKDQQI